MATKAKAKKARKKARKQPKLTADEQREFQERTSALVDEIKDRRGKLEQAKQAAKSMKEMYQGSVAELERVTYEFTHPEALPLFRDNGKVHKNGKPTKEEPKADTPAAPVGGDAWKFTTIKEALPNMPKKFYECCESQQLETIGALMDWKNSVPSRWWTDLGKGVATATIDKLDDAIIEFINKQIATIGTDK